MVGDALRFNAFSSGWVVGLVAMMGVVVGSGSKKVSECQKPFPARCRGQGRCNNHKIAASTVKDVE